jgi:hypothetical protein
LKEPRDDRRIRTAVDAPVAAPDALVRPWRRATIVASLIAALELVVIVVAGVVVLAKPLAHAVQKQAEVRAFEPVAKKEQAPVAKQAKAAPSLTRHETGVLVLNGNGRTGAASAGADRLRRFGYMIAGTGNAPRSDYATSVVMYRPGYGPEARRLARDLKLKVVGPLDGLKPSALHGAQLAVVLGAR